MKNGFYLWSPDIDSVVSRPALDKLSLAVSRLLNSETESLRNELATANALAKESFEHWAQSVLVNIDDLKEENRAHELAGKDYYEHMMKDENAIADYQEQAANLIQSGIDADNALELANEQLADLRFDFHNKRQELTDLQAELNSEQVEMSAMQVDNTKLWKENEHLRQQLGEPVIDDIGFGEFLKQSLVDDVTNMQHELDTQALHEYHKTRKESDLYFIDYEDGAWYIIKQGETIAEDYSHSVQDAISKCAKLVEYQDIVERPVIPSDSYNQVEVNDTPVDDLIQCNVCGVKSECDVIWADNGDIITACETCVQSGKTLTLNHDD